MTNGSDGARRVPTPNRLCGKTSPDTIGECFGNQTVKANDELRRGGGVGNLALENASVFAQVLRRRIKPLRWLSF